MPGFVVRTSYSAEVVHRRRWKTERERKNNALRGIEEIGSARIPHGTGGAFCGRRSSCNFEEGG